MKTRNSNWCHSHSGWQDTPYSINRICNAARKWENVFDFSSFCMLCVVETVEWKIRLVRPYFIYPLAPLWRRRTPPLLFVVISWYEVHSSLKRVVTNPPFSFLFMEQCILYLIHYSFEANLKIHSSMSGAHFRDRVAPHQKQELQLK